MNFARRSDNDHRIGMSCVALCAVLFLMSAGTRSHGQDSGDESSPGDVLITRRADSDQTVKRRGAVVQWKGSSITFHSTGRDRTIPNGEIVKLETTWDPNYLAGNDELQQGKTQLAILKYQEALGTESRLWAQHIIRSKLVDAYQSIEQPGLAAEQFSEIVREDSQTRFMYLAPLPWIGSGDALRQPSLILIEQSDPIKQLIGASWLLGGPQREQAIKVLESLATDIDPRIKSAAIAQLWRSRPQVNARQIEVWQGILEEMPRSLRAGPLLVLADAQARVGNVNPALINLMRIPILYPEQRSIAAAALFRAANLLQQQGQTDQAKALVNELVTQYPQSIWAQQKATQ